MATIKSYTDLEQSKKLAEILPLESADMAYWKRSHQPNDYAITAYHTKELQEEFKAKCIEYIPCWSLAALLDILPDDLGDNHFLTLDKEDNEYCCCYEDNDGNSFRHTFANNPVDACAAMVEKLHQLKML